MSIKKITQMSKQDEVALWETSSRSELITFYYPLAELNTKTLYKYPSFKVIEYDMLFSLAVEALIELIDRYNYKKGNHIFSAYAYYYLRKRVYNYLRTAHFNYNIIKYIPIPYDNMDPLQSIAIHNLLTKIKNEGIKLFRGKKRKIIFQLMLQGYKSGEICKKTGISITNISTTKRYIKNIIYRKWGKEFEEIIRDN